jgi:hypothetical protein
MLKIQKSMRNDEGGRRGKLHVRSMCIRTPCGLLIEHHPLPLPLQLVSHRLKSSDPVAVFSRPHLHLPGPTI